MFNLGNKKSPEGRGTSPVTCRRPVHAARDRRPRTAQAAAPAPLVTVAKSPLGSAQSAFTGTTASGKRVTGNFTPLRFSKKNGNLRARGLVRGVVHQAGPNSRFAVVRTAAGAAGQRNQHHQRAAGSCGGSGLPHPAPAARPDQPQPARTEDHHEQDQAEHRRRARTRQPARQPALRDRRTPRRSAHSRPADQGDEAVEPDPGTPEPGSDRFSTAPRSGAGAIRRPTFVRPRPPSGRERISG